MALTKSTYRMTAGEQANVLDFGAVLNDSSAAVRTANKTALQAAIDSGNSVYIPKGTLWIDGGINAVNVNITGAGRGKTTIKGDGDLFTSCAGIKAVDFDIANDSTKGKLFICDTGAAPVGKTSFFNIDFGVSNYHIYANATCVGWYFEECRFGSAAVASRWYHGAYACTDVFSYIWNNEIGLQIKGGGSYGYSMYGCVIELNLGVGIDLQCDTAEGISSFLMSGCYFEKNSLVAGDPDINLQTSAAARIRNVKLDNCLFMYGASGVGAKTKLMDITLGGTGTADNITFKDTFFNAACDTTVNTNDVYFDSCTFNKSSSGYVPLSNNYYYQPHAYEYAQSDMGAKTISGVNDGSNAVQATITPPLGAKTALIMVQGNYYNGSANTNTGYYEARWNVNTNSIHDIVDVDHTSGSNQGFVATWTGSAIQIANKASMTNNQSGDTTILFYA